MKCSCCGIDMEFEYIGSFKHELCIRCVDDFLLGMKDSIKMWKMCFQTEKEVL